MLDLHDPTTLLVLEIVGGAVLTFGAGAAATWLYKDVARKRRALAEKKAAAALTETKDDDRAVEAEEQRVEPILQAEEAIAETLEKKSPAGLLARIFRRK